MGASLVVASNRGPVQFTGDSDETAVPRRGGGGLVTAIGPALADGGGVWIAASMSDADRRVAASRPMLTVVLPEGRIRLRLLSPAQEVYDAFYNEIGNRVLWPLNHCLFDLARGPAFDGAFRAAWKHFRTVNEGYAAACADAAATNAEVFVHDYHLALAPSALRRSRPDLKIAHYTHCPWPDPHYFAVLPTGRELIEGMLGADLLGFEVPRWAANFLRCCAALGHQVDSAAVLAPDGRRVQVRSYPLGVDATQLRRAAAAPAVAAGRRRLSSMSGDAVVVVRVDRLEPSKNILRGLRAFQELLTRRPELRGRIVHWVLAYESRQQVPEYQRYAGDLHSAVAEINARFGDSRWTPVRLATDDDYPRSLAALSLADMIVVNPLWDGQNMVAKEGPVINEKDAPLLLSRNAGAADDLAAGALMVNPFDTAELADAMAAALDMTAEERAERAALVREAAVRAPPREWFGQQRRDLAEAAGLQASTVHR
ncbi:alpha,alpha-trehalose-phosphate synthase (UDP-forming) [Actinomadura rubrisoli]|uniref:Trehalose-6-phosphate synthase n=1 Tax=Actinomadura rubrisoli TaxID=2530368 RepID=A0A4R5CEK1_9ACTN|nr:trehalose-6-phosphate synthase [Actinomadura rubrisoli]TDD96790.1 trehalose-6-phosphate synthase [Actinomadura rubrisoli]